MTTPDIEDTDAMFEDVAAVLEKYGIKTSEHRAAVCLTLAASYWAEANPKMRPEDRSMTFTLAADRFMDDANGYLEMEAGLDEARQKIVEVFRHD